jgi:hypothetical protein
LHADYDERENCKNERTSRMRHSCSPESNAKKPQMGETNPHLRNRGPEPTKARGITRAAPHCRLLYFAMRFGLYPAPLAETRTMKLLHDVGASRLNKTIFGKTNPRCALATERQVFGENTRRHYWWPVNCVQFTGRPVLHLQMGRCLRGLDSGVDLAKGQQIELDIHRCLTRLQY